jgi:hypothetical protein
MARESHKSLKFYANNFNTMNGKLIQNKFGRKSAIEY